MIITVSSAQCSRCLNLWNGTGNASEPGGWALLDFDDHAWPQPTEAYKVDAWTVAAQPMWSESLPRSRTDVCLFRAHFALPPGVVSASIVLSCDDNLMALWLNDHHLTTIVAGSSTPSDPQEINPAILNAGGDNVMAIEVANNSAPGPSNYAYVSYLLTIEATGTWPTEPSEGSTSGLLAGERLRDAVRVRHRSGVLCWESDGSWFRIFSGDVCVVEWPLAALAEPPATWVGRHPTTHRPVYFPNPLGSYALRSDIPADTGPTPLPAEHVIQTTPLRLPDVVPDPVVDNCPLIRCGAALQLATKLKGNYDLIRHLLLFMLFAPLFAGALDAALVGLLAWLARSEAAAWIADVIRTILQVVKSGSSFVSADIEDIGDAGRDELAHLAYGVLGCSENTFKLTQEMLNNWAALIELDTAHFTEWQRHLLVYCVQLTPFGTWDQTAASGALNPSSLCSTW